MGHELEVEAHAIQPPVNLDQGSPVGPVLSLNFLDSSTTNVEARKGPNDLRVIEVEASVASIAKNRHTARRTNVKERKNRKWAKKLVGECLISSSEDEGI